jgi:DinB family protein
MANRVEGVARDLRNTIDGVLPKLRAIPDAMATEPRAPGKWSRKEIIGHLIDSASNNHQRFIRAQQVSPLSFPPYDQNHWAESQHCNERSWKELVTLWHAYNTHLAHVIERIPEARLDVPCVIESNSPVTLEFLVTDYVVHLRHHLAQVGVV